MKRILASACVALLGVVSMGAPARAAEVAPHEPSVLVPRERPTRREFYGWEILVIAEPASLVAAGSVLLPDRPLGSVVSTVGFLVGMPVYALGGPIVHWRHGAFQKGLLAFGGNFAFPLIGGLVGSSLRCGENGAPINCGSRGFFSGFAVGVLVAPVVDAVALGWEDVPIEDVVMGRDNDRRASLGREKRAGFSIEPTWSFGPRGSLELGVAGRF
jgi:hypothetical protein